MPTIPSLSGISSKLPETTPRKVAEAIRYSTLASKERMGAKVAPLRGKPALYFKALLNEIKAKASFML